MTTFNWHVLELPDNLLDLADDRGYLVDTATMDLPDGTLRPVWLCLDLSDETFVAESLAWKSHQEAVDYILGHS